MLCIWLPLSTCARRADLSSWRPTTIAWKPPRGLLQFRSRRCDDWHAWCGAPRRSGPRPFNWPCHDLGQHPSLKPTGVLEALVTRSALASAAASQSPASRDRSGAADPRVRSRPLGDGPLGGLSRAADQWWRADPAQPGRHARPRARRPCRGAVDQGNDPRPRPLSRADPGIVRGASRRARSI